MSNKKILIVDDEAQLVDMLKMRFQAEGYDVITAFDGKEGLKKAKDFKPDLIILDIMMPIMSGSEVAAVLKEDEQFSQIPIIFLTCLAVGIADKQSNEQIGGNLFIAKPFETDELMLMVDKILKK